VNYPILAAGVITFLAFIAHTFVGNKEALSTAPGRLGNSTDGSGFETVERNWVQSMCAFQLVTVDLLVLSVLLFALGATDYINPERQVALALVVFYVLWGTAWVIQLVVLKRQGKDFLILSQWLFWFVCAVLIYWGAQSL
jgi:hypothetical protein